MFFRDINNGIYGLYRGRVTRVPRYPSYALPSKVNFTVCSHDKFNERRESKMKTNIAHEKHVHLD